MNTSADVESSYPEGDQRVYYVQLRAGTVLEDFSPNVRKVFAIKVSNNDEESDRATNCGENERRSHFLLEIVQGRGKHALECKSSMNARKNI